ncbi:MAG TPA: fumarylacetoacetate hydrolase family protein [Hellea balneolensis]|uniref:Fumarylacetoacetate hydrolase family protein n=1 Tax=Hellea balneolensis TaxID=287478 RepID=A0A7C5R8E1_9PROT|nr:fumarylacetoacetate hydrolase family protein [Hellea balneolensis]
MQFRKIKSGPNYKLQSLKGENWQDVKPGTEPFKAFLRATGGAEFDAQDPKPFAPKSYRDFMLYERHYIQAATNYAKAHKPAALKIAQIYQKITGKVHPKLKPSKLWYQAPIFYMGGHMNFYGDGDEIHWPAYSNTRDYELEIGCVLAEPLLNASPQEAAAAIGGFVVFNDFSARDLQMPEMESGFGPQKSKHFANAISSTFVTADEILPRLGELTGHVSINGEKVGAVHSSGMQYTLPEAIAHVSKGERLYPGEFFATGTLPNGCGLENGHMLDKGDTVTLEIEGIGQVSNTIV